MRIVLWLAATTVVLAGGLWLGGTAGWRLHEAALRKGCLPLAEDVVSAQVQPADPARLRFAALGDTGTGTAAARGVAQALRQVCAREGCDFVALLGDNIYPDGVRGVDDPLFNSAFESIYAGLDIPVLALLGNHDVHGQVLAQLLYSRKSKLWRMPNYEYAFQAGPARIFAVNTNCQPLTWWHLEPQLAAPFAGWTFVLGHHALYGEGPHGDAGWAERWVWGDVQPEVDFYLAGHNHVLGHYRPQDERTDYVVSGSGGAAPADTDAPLVPSAARRAFFSPAAGFAWFEVSAQQVLLRFYDETGQQLYSYTRAR